MVQKRSNAWIITPPPMKDERYFAHTKKVAGKVVSETLWAHSQLTLEYFEQYGAVKGIAEVLRGLIYACGFTGREAEVVYEHFVYALYLHDWGKINPRYQYEVLKNQAFRQLCRQINNSKHSLASAYLYVDYMAELYPSECSAAVMKCRAAFAFIISRHHAGLNNGHDFSELEDFDEPYCSSELEEEAFADIRFYLQRSDQVEPLAFYILNKLLYALLVACDHCATQEFMTGSAVEPTIIETGGLQFLKLYEQSERCQGIRRYQENPEVFEGKPINALRNRIFLEAERNLKARPQAHIYYLEAPTGAGKTNLVVNLSLQLLQMNHKLNNIFYVFPFNTLAEQTETVLRPYFGEQMAVVNSITPIISDKDEETENYDSAWLDHILNNYPVVLTSHVNFFNALFGCSRRQSFPLLKLCHSVVVLDEIQSYKNSIWREIITFLQKYARLLDMKIIIMSATLPQLDTMLPNVDAQFVSLLENSSLYYNAPLFKERVKLDFSLLEEGKITLDRLRQEVLRFKEQRVLVEFIKKKTAREFYLLCKEDCNVVLLTGDDNAARRQEIIKRIRSGEKMILIATQIIEAGIDIDMDIGFKDISLFDSEEQFLGRINRSCLREGAMAYFFDFDDAAVVYRQDVRLRYSIREPDIRQWLIEKQFTKFYNHVMADLIAASSRSNTRNIANMGRNCAQLNFKTITEQMRLIEPNWQLFIPYRWKDRDGYQTWERFKSLGADKEMGYAERMVRYSQLALEMSYFTYSVFKNQIPAGVEEYGGYYFIDGGERFIDDEGILDRKALEDFYGGLFL